MKVGLAFSRHEITETLSIKKENWISFTFLKLTQTNNGFCFKSKDMRGIINCYNIVLPRAGSIINVSEKNWRLQIS